IETPSVDERSSYHIFPIVLNSSKTDITRDVFIDKMKEFNIGISVHYLPLHFFSYYRNKYGWVKEDFPVATYIGENCVTLPLYPALTIEKQDYIINKVKQTLGAL